jgi:hypothetical protein
MVLGVFDSDVSAATEAAQTAKLKKKKNTREYEVGTDPRLKRTLAVLEEENKLCMEVSAKYKVLTASPNRIPEHTSLAFRRGTVQLTRVCGCEGNAAVGG